MKLEKKLIALIFFSIVIGMLVILPLAFLMKPPIRHIRYSINPITIKINDQINIENFPIQRSGNVYTLTKYTEAEIIVEKNNIIIDGGHYLLNSTTFYGIKVIGRNNVTIQNFNINSSLGGYAIYLQNSSNIIIKDNNITSGNTGIFIEGEHGKTENNTIIGNSLTSTLVDSIFLMASSNNLIKGNFINDCKGKAIDIFSQSTDNLVENNYIFNSTFGVWVFQSSNNTIKNNIVLENGDGIRIMACMYNTVKNNFIQNNRIGIIIDAGRGEYVSNNYIVNNSFINNNQQVYSILDAINIWDINGEGNYWSDYSGEDKNLDGIGDTPYILNENNKDSHPIIDIVSD